MATEKLTTDDERVADILSAASELAAAYRKWVNLFEEFRVTTGMALATPNELFMLSGTDKMLQRMNAHMAHRLERLQEGIE